MTKLCSKKNPGYRDFKSQYWKKILGTEMSKSWYWKKILGAGISNPSTGNRIYIRENFPGASRPSKTLTGVLIGTRNQQSLGGLCCTVYKYFLYSLFQMETKKISYKSVQ